MRTLRRPLHSALKNGFRALSQFLEIAEELLEGREAGSEQGDSMSMDTDV